MLSKRINGGLSTDSVVNKKKFNPRLLGTIKGGINEDAKC
jgi:hypothetical protein